MNKKAFYILAVFFVLTGSLNTIVAKWIDNLHSTDRNGIDQAFNHPFLQAWCMFIGEFLCLLVFNLQIWKLRNDGVEIVPGKHVALPSSRLIYILPAMCDLTGTTMLYIGLTMTHASVAQMLRGSSMIFTAFFSIVFLKATVHGYQWAGIIVTAVGLALVGVSSMVLSTSDDDAPNPIVGNIMVISAQVVVGIQMVVEQKILTKYEVPAMQTVGWEGFWGVVMMGAILGLFQAWPSVFPGHGMPDDFIDGFIMIKNREWLIVAFILSFVSIAFFNYFGLTITKNISATTRTVLDSIRTTIIWGFGLATGVAFQWLQPIGFIVMLLGTAIYQKMIIVPGLYYPPTEETEAIVNNKDSSDTSVTIHKEADGETSPSAGLRIPVLFKKK